MNNFIYIKNAPNEYTKLAYQEILWIESEGHFCIFHCEDRKKINLKISLSNLEKELPQKHFTRIRRNIIVNKMQVSDIHLATDQLLINGLPLSIGRTYRIKVFEQFNLLG